MQQADRDRFDALLFVLPVALLLGSLFLIWVDVAARTLIAPEDLPIGIATAAIGGLFFIGMMRRR